METQQQKAITLFNKREYSKSFKICKTFKRTFEPEELRTIEIASETLTMGGAIYRQMGIDTESEILKAKKLIRKKVINK